ncbi:hypothetical protein HU200_012008 [Digitaria exilis]|uniref:GTP cyclohydrolase 1 n=1 Tax=Digitaria exilis TaxID=1010633 RepID=A0A835FH55_9POAL|nr:hypothetical protein HU200_012008 [Digitaria exilis]
MGALRGGPPSPPPGPPRARGERRRMTSSCSAGEADPPRRRTDAMEPAVRALLVGLGEDERREGLRRTPKRVAKAFRDGTRGYRQKVKDIVQGALFPEVGVDKRTGSAGGTGGQVVVRDIELFSYCESSTFWSDFLALLKLRGIDMDVGNHSACIPWCPLSYLNALITLERIPSGKNFLGTPQRYVQWLMKFRVV